MYDPIFAKSFSRYDRRRFGCIALLFSFILSLTICSTFKPSLHPLTLIGDAVNLHLSISAVESMLIDEAIIINASTKEVKDSALRIDETELPRLNQSNVELPNPKKELVTSGAGLPRPDQEKVDELTNPQNELMIDETELPRLDQEKVELPNPENELTVDETELPRLDQEKVELPNQQNELTTDETELPRLKQEKVELPNPENELTVDKTELPRLSQEKVELLNPEIELVINETEVKRPQIDQNKQEKEPLNPQNKLIINKSEQNPPHIDQKQNVEPSNPRNELVINEPERNPPQFRQKLSSEPLCRILKANADYCELEGDVRVDPNSSTIFLVKPRSTIPATSSWIIEPYPRKGTGFVKKWTVKIAADDDSSVPKCGESHSQPALLFSIGGFSGNHFHDFADLIVPLFTTSFRFKTEVQFLAAADNNKQWWLGKYRPLLNRLTRHAIVDIAREKAAHCYKNLIAGLQYYGELVVDPASGTEIRQFRQLLRRTYSLDRDKAIQYTNKEEGASRPRLLIVSRKGTRILTNEDQISKMARKLGFEVVSAEGSVSANLTKFAQVVNSCDVMLGVHGAGLTNMVFLPEKAVLIQIVPLGAIDIFARLDFGNPSGAMNLRYLEYKIETKESSLIERYPIDHPVIRDPKSVHREGWGKLREVYLNNQNVTIDARRFRATLSKAFKLLRH